MSASSPVRVALIGPTTVGGHGARAALRIALACIEAVETGTTVTVRDHDHDHDREAAA